MIDLVISKNNLIATSTATHIASRQQQNNVIKWGKWLIWSLRWLHFQVSKFGNLPLELFKGKNIFLICILKRNPQTEWKEIGKRWFCSRITFFSILFVLRKINIYSIPHTYHREMWVLVWNWPSSQQTKSCLTLENVQILVHDWVEKLHVILSVWWNPADTFT